MEGLKVLPLQDVEQTGADTWNDVIAGKAGMNRGLGSRRTLCEPCDCLCKLVRSGWRSFGVKFLKGLLCLEAGEVGSKGNWEETSTPGSASHKLLEMVLRLNKLRKHMKILNWGSEKPGSFLQIPVQGETRGSFAWKWVKTPEIESGKDVLLETHTSKKRVVQWSPRK